MIDSSMANDARQRGSILRPEPRYSKTQYRKAQGDGLFADDSRLLTEGLIALSL
jgi:hypothetical protein